MPAHSSPKSPHTSSVGKTISRLALVLMGSSVLFGLVAMWLQQPKVPTKPEVTTATTASTAPGTTAVAGQPVQVAFSQLAGEKVVTVNVTRAMPQDYAPISVEYALQELLKGPNRAESEQGLYSEIPKGTRLLGVTKADDGSVIVNLSKQFTTGGGANSVIHRLEEVKNTLNERVGNFPVAIHVEGDVLKVLGPEGLELDTPDTAAPPQTPEAKVTTPSV